jgi:hypothetical protein
MSARKKRICELGPREAQMDREARADLLAKRWEMREALRRKLGIADPAPGSRPQAPPARSVLTLWLPED